jgi:hypothetical protein
MMGFELELEVLVDVNGRPPPEKRFLGSYGAERLELQVDHNGAVEGQTPVSAADADFTVATQAPPLVGAPAMAGYGPFDLPRATGTGQPIRWDVHSRSAPGGPVVADPRGALAYQRLVPSNWAAATSSADFTRPIGAGSVGLSNAFLPIIDAATPRYALSFHAWESALADAQLQRIDVAADHWLRANATPPSMWHPIDRATYFSARATLTALRAEVATHRAFWAANPAPLAGFTRQYRRTVGAGAAGAWQARHPIAGAGTERYASILEIVTRPYAPETAPGKLGLINAMTEANQLAADIEARTTNFAHRARLEAIVNTNISNPETYVGNDGATRNPQRTDASIQSTFAVDLSQLPSLMYSTVATMAPQNRFSLKHQADVGASAEDRVNRAEREMTLAVADATAVINELKGRIGGGAPSFVNLRGLLTLVCQYLRMGKYWDPGGVQVLDKNLTDLLSRTDLAQIYRDAVPDTEKIWTGAHLNHVIGRLLARTARGADRALFNQPADDRAPAAPPPFDLSCRQFVTRVFTVADDGVTPHLGGFQRRPVEDIDPAGARRAGEQQRATFAHRQAPVFEMRNMIPKTSHAAELVAGGEAQRFRRADWVPLAQYMGDLIDVLNTRPEAAAIRDVKFEEGGGVGARNVRPAQQNW